MRSAPSKCWRFLPTPSAWRATRCYSVVAAQQGSISTHALRMEGDLRTRDYSFAFDRISTHALRMEGDNPITVPADMTYRISTHALRMEGDSHRRRTKMQAEHFYPRPPHGGRPVGVKAYLYPFLFLPTPSAWRATGVGISISVTHTISTHALRMEGDSAFPLHHLVYRISTHALRMEGDGPAACL